MALYKAVFGVGSNETMAMRLRYADGGGPISPYLYIWFFDSVLDGYVKY